MLATNNKDNEMFYLVYESLVLFISATLVYWAILAVMIPAVVICSLIASAFQWAKERVLSLLETGDSNESN